MENQVEQEIIQKQEESMPLGLTPLKKKPCSSQARTVNTDSEPLS